MSFKLPPSALEIADTLGLRDGSYKTRLQQALLLSPYRYPFDDPQVPSFARPYIPAALDRYDMTIALDSVLDLEGGRLLIIEFTHLYLPQLVEAVAYAFDEQAFINDWAKVLSFLSLVSNPVLSRYCRLPKEGNALRDITVRGLCGEIPGRIKFIEEGIALSQNVLPLEKLSYGILLNRIKSLNLLLTNATSLDFPLSTIKRTPPWLELRFYLLQLLEIAVRNHARIEHYNILVQFVDDTARLLKGEWEREEMLHSVTQAPWWRCEATTQPGVGECEGRSDGVEDFHACSRCMSVRYCSAAHQKAHWKAHKKICRKPIW